MIDEINNVADELDDPLEDFDEWDLVPLEDKINHIRTAKAKGYITPELMGSTLQDLLDCSPQPSNDISDIVKLFD